MVMSKERLQQQCNVRIIHDTDEDHLSIGRNDSLTIGSDPKNDIVLNGEHVPKRHTLLSHKNGSFCLFVTESMHGEILIDDSRLALIDLIKHGFLPRSKDLYAVPVTPGKTGYVLLDQTRIDFSCETTVVEPVVEYAEYSWLRVFIKDAVRDPFFKIVFASVFIAAIVLISRLIGMEIQERQAINLEQVHERFARFIVRSQIETPDESSRVSTAAPAETGEISEAESDRESTDSSGEAAETRTSPRARPIMTQGLLGLISGTGSSERDASIVDVLMDKGLAQELTEVAGETNLRVGRRNGESSAASDGLDELLEATTAGGIDDLLGDLDDGVPSVELRKDGQVSVERTTSIIESDEAVGQRDEESLIAVVTANMGRITYIYNKYLKRDPQLQGKISLDISIAASGRITKIDVAEDTVLNREFLNELLNAVRRWRFDPIDRGIVMVNYPFVFYKQG